MGEFRECSRPFQRLFIDFLGPYPATKSGFTCMFVVIDQYSRFIFVEPMRQATSQNIIKFLEKNIFSVFSVPEEIWCDNGKQFTSNVFKEVLENYGITLRLSAKYSPQGNMSERVNRSLLAAIRAYIVEDHREWDVHIYSIAGPLRNVIHESTKFSPHYLVFGMHKIMHGSDYKLLRLLQSDFEVGANSTANRLSVAQEFVLKNLREAYFKHSKTYNLRSRTREFTVGQEVLVRNFVASDASKRFVAKFAHKFIKATILKRVGSVAFEVANEKGKSIGVYHIKDIIA